MFPSTGLCAHNLQVCWSQRLVESPIRTPNPRSIDRPVHHDPKVYRWSGRAWRAPEYAPNEPQQGLNGLLPEDLERAMLVRRYRKPPRLTALP